MIPTTPEECAAIEPNGADRSLEAAWRSKSPIDYMVYLRLAAVSRIAEHERCVKRLAGYLSTLPGNTDKHPEELLPEARRILEEDR